MGMQSMDSHFNFRMSGEDKRLIEMASKLMGLRSNTYARQKLIEAAKHDIEQMNQFNSLTLSESDWDMFMQVMESPVKINKNLKKAVSDYRKAFD